MKLLRKDTILQWPKRKGSTKHGLVTPLIVGVDCCGHYTSSIMVRFGCNSFLNRFICRSDLFRDSTINDLFWNQDVWSVPDRPITLTLVVVPTHSCGLPIPWQDQTKKQKMVITLGSNPELVQSVLPNLSFF